MKKKLAILLAFVLALGCLAGCSSGTESTDAQGTAAQGTVGQEGTEGEAEEASGELVIYTTVSDLQYNALVGAFQEKYPNIEISYTQAGAGECKSRIQAEVENPQGDVMFGGLVYADTLSMADCFENYVSPNDANLPDEFKNTTGILTYHDTQIPCLWVNDAL